MLVSLIIDRSGGESVHSGGKQFSFSRNIPLFPGTHLPVS